MAPKFGFDMFPKSIKLMPVKRGLARGLRRARWFVGAVYADSPTSRRVACRQQIRADFVNVIATGGAGSKDSGNLNRLA